MKKVLWFHPRPLYPVRSGGEVRVSGLIQAVANAGHEVLLVQPGFSHGAPDNFHAVELVPRRGLGRIIAKICPPAPLRAPRVTRRSRAAARKAIERFDPDITVVSEVMSWSVTRVLCPQVPWIYDAHNVESALYDELVESADGLLDKLTLLVDRRRVTQAERLMLSEADFVTAVSAEDAQAFRKSGSTSTIVVPSSVVTPPPRGALTDEPIMLFVGTLDYPPNVLAIEELVTEILPRVRERVPDARLQIVGRRPTKRIRELAHPGSGVDLAEDVADLSLIYSAARCAVLPIRTGGGSRLKVLEALANGLPLVGTSRTFSGVEVDPSAVVIRESPEAIADAAVSILVDDVAAGRLSTRARAQFEGSLSWPTAARPLVSLIDELSIRSRGARED